MPPILLCDPLIIWTLPLPLPPMQAAAAAPAPAAAVAAPPPMPMPAASSAPAAAPAVAAASPTGYSLSSYTTFPGSNQPVFTLCYNTVGQSVFGGVDGGILCV